MLDTETFKDLSKVKNIIFDYDGTLHNSIKIYGPSFRLAFKYLVETNQAMEREWLDDEISVWLGYSSKDMWNNFMPDLIDSEKEKCSKIIGDNMVKLINDGFAELYKGTLETLKYLNEKNYNIIFLSNCKIDYMNKHINMFGLDKYFDDFYCTEQFNFMPKYQIFIQIKEKYPDDFIIIGDRDVDIEIATKHNELSIGCNYGFGSENELIDANIRINDITDLLKLL